MLLLLLGLVVFGSSLAVAADDISATDHNSAHPVGEDVLSCLKETNLTYEEVNQIEFFNPNKTISRNAKCFAGCLISTDYNVSVSSEGIVEKEGLLLSAIMQSSDVDLKNATELVDGCKKTVKAEVDTCENIYNYATCVNQKYFEMKGYSNHATGNILEQYDPPNGTVAMDGSNTSSTTTIPTTNVTQPSS